MLVGDTSLSDYIGGEYGIRLTGVVDQIQITGLIVLTIYYVAVPAG